MHPLTNEEADAVLKFLPKKPAHCAYLAGLIEENGLASPLNRGAFYASRNFLSEIQGVALVGHATIIEPTNNESVRDLADVARNWESTHLVMCEERWADEFWKHYRTTGRSPRVESRELLLELRWPTIHSNSSRQQLRLATTRDLELLVPVHAGLASAESGIDPRDVDNEAFIERYHQRILKIFSERILISVDGSSALADVLHQFLCYVETLIRQVKMRAVLADERNLTFDQVSLVNSTYPQELPLPLQTRRPWAELAFPA